MLDNGQVFRCEAGGWTRISSPWTEGKRLLTKGNHTPTINRVYNRNEVLSENDAEHLGQKQISSHTHSVSPDNRQNMAHE